LTQTMERQPTSTAPNAERVLARLSTWASATRRHPR
jgi:hypothetical protein